MIILNLILSFIKANKNAILIGVVVIAVFMLGRLSKSTPPPDISQITKELDSLRTSNKLIANQRFMEAVRRGSMQKEFSSRMAHHDSVLKATSIKIQWYESQIKTQRTANEIQTTMLSIYNHRNDKR